MKDLCVKLEDKQRELNGLRKELEDVKKERLYALQASPADGMVGQFMLVGCHSLVAVSSSFETLCIIIFAGIRLKEEWVKKMNHSWVNFNYGVCF